MRYTRISGFLADDEKLVTELLAGRAAAGPCCGAWERTRALCTP
ncbi:MAG: hypothetical protein OXF73_12855 [Gammaproteobacteria bacterium]|nr:hypothetical protein [Gammaproteobacteria bacterium]